MFDPELNKEDPDSSILSPSWIDRKANGLLEAVELKRKASSVEYYTKSSGPDVIAGR